MILSKLVSIFVLFTFAFAYFSQKQLELVDLHYKIQPKSNNNKVRTFYSVLAVPPNVNDIDLEKAYKKLSRKWHPDKFLNKSSKERKQAERKFETLSLIIGILRDVDSRKNYDYFLKKGFPIWSSSKSRYVFPNRSKPSLLVSMGIVLIILSFGQILILKLNKSQKNKRIAKILRDVKWKADNMTKKDESNNKIFELPSDFEVSEFNSGFCADDRLVTYCDKLFIVKSDTSVLLYNEKIDVNNENEINEVIKKIIDSGHFSLYGFSKKPMNRKERRQLDMKTVDADDNDVLDKLVILKEDESSVKIGDFLIVKLIIRLWNVTINKLIDNGDVNNKEKINKDENGEKKDETKTADIKKNKIGKMTLPNGKILHPRKK